MPPIHGHAHAFSNANAPVFIAQTRSRKRYDYPASSCSGIHEYREALPYPLSCFLFSMLRLDQEILERYSCEAGYWKRPYFFEDTYVFVILHLVSEACVVHYSFEGAIGHLIVCFSPQEFQADPVPVMVDA